ncbi:hypothetical protein WMY93_009224 [Mugilogobius chulae]|uniref:MADF domain-containing protein n=1 Tax=Mugilogobius chulae TaxID=88201 RepID=A0AAW0PE79_9GOBI
MDEFEEQVVEEVRRYEHLYNSSSPYHKDARMTLNSWRKISTNLNVDVNHCIKKWKTIMDKFVRMKKRMVTHSGDPGGRTVPAFYTFMSWLAPHVKHRDTESNFTSQEGPSTQGISFPLTENPPPTPSTPSTPQPSQSFIESSTCQFTPLTHSVIQSALSSLPRIPPSTPTTYCPCFCVHPAPASVSTQPPASVSTQPPASVFTRPCFCVHPAPASVSTQPTARPSVSTQPPASVSPSPCFCVHPAHCSPFCVHQPLLLCPPSPLLAFCVHPAPASVSTQPPASVSTQPPARLLCPPSPLLLSTQPLLLCPPSPCSVSTQPLLALLCSPSPCFCVHPPPASPSVSTHPPPSVSTHPPARPSVSTHPPARRSVSTHPPLTSSFQPSGSSEAPAEQSTPQAKQRKRRQEPEDVLLQRLADMQERRLEMQQQLVDQQDECHRFAQSLADLLARMPENRRPAAIWISTQLCTSIWSDFLL